MPARFRRERVLVVGCGDIGLRAARALGGRVRLLALTSSRDRIPALRQAGLVPLVGDLDRPATLRRLAGIAHRVLHLAPPPRGNTALVAPGSPDAPHPHGPGDPRTLALVRALSLRSFPTSLVYGSTSGVYGDCGGARIDETRALRPATARAKRRVDAELAVRWFGRLGVATRILRIPGIYANDREGGTPRDRLAKGTPILRAEDDVYTNHIHADDLARACVAALYRGGTQRAFHVSDDSAIRMGDYIELAAGLFGLPRPPRISREEAGSRLPAMQLSFMGESRRLDNRRLKRELRLRLRFPTVGEGLRHGMPPAT
ncbi:NAD(P)-dependent oxidoreductase [Burkholderiales bacterium 8X]|nr:NAD(P)-dependent oxidoreductase [Burkholderiales bacterium 8X]